MKAVPEGNDVFDRLPTGFGRSVIIAFLPLGFDYLQQARHATSVILCESLLIALQQRKVQEGTNCRVYVVFLSVIL